MNCADIQNRLSDYHDAQLVDAECEEVESHLQTCHECSEVLSQYRAISSLSEQATTPAASQHIWATIDEQLSSSPSPSTVRREEAKSSRYSWRAFAIIATVLLALGLSVFSLLDDHGHRSHLSVDFDAYLDHFAVSPEMATEHLFARYSAEPVSIEEAIDRVGYSPVIANSLPDGYQVDSIHVMEMPCCKCIKTLCRTEKNQPFVIFEHDAEQPIWFGDRPRRSCECGGMKTEVVDFDNQIAATWRVANRSVTVVGLKDEDAVAHLMPYLGH